MDYAEKMQRCHEYVEALEEEKRKIQVFQRELPLCLELVTQAIEACRRELSGTTTDYMHGQSECSEQTSSAAPVLEEFMPLKSPDCNDRDRHSEEDDNKKATNNRDKNGDSKKKSDWLRSVQLWNNNNNQFTESDPSPPPKVEEVGRKATVVEVKKNGGAFQPFHKEKSAGKNNDTTTNTDQAKSVGKTNNSPAAVPATSSTTETVSNKSGGGSGGTSKKEEKEKEGQRKQRRCWSPELHRRFLHALQQLGGSHVATPKQIRELMKVDGLTNDEVKSHLQKYRLHTRRPTPTIHNNGTTQAPQFVVVGGIWVPPPEYAATASKQPGEATVVANKIYAPVAAPPPCSVGQSSVSLMQISQSEHMNSDERNSSHSEGAIHSSSPATSSSTHTTTASPAL